MTKEEKRAVSSLNRLAKRWPSSLVLVKHCDSPGVSVKRRADVNLDDPALTESIDFVDIEILVVA